MASRVTYTPKLRLRIPADATADTRYNLLALDAIAEVTSISSEGVTQLQGESDVLIEPSSSNLGGSGSGGNVYIGLASHVIDQLYIYSTLTTLSGPLSLKDQASGGSGYLQLKYDSTVSGTVDTSATRTLSIDMQAGNRSLVLAGNLALAASLSTVGAYPIQITATASTDITLPTSGVVATLAGVEDLTNKSVSESTWSGGTITGTEIDSTRIGQSLPNKGAFTQLTATSGSISGDTIATLLAAQSVYNKAINTSTVDGSVVGGSVPAAGTFTSLACASLLIAGHTAATIDTEQTLTNKTISSPIVTGTINSIWTLPSGDGSVNQVLKTNGAGGLSWQTVAPAGGLTQDYMWAGDSTGNPIESKVYDKHVASDAALALTKLAALTASKAVVSNSSGILTSSTTTAAEIGYLSGVTSSVQTQLGGKVPTSRSISTSAPLSGGNTLANDLTLSIGQSSSTTDGYLSSTDWGTFNTGAGLAATALQSSSFTDAAVTGKLLTGFISGAGSVAATDSILQAFNKLDGNIAGVSSVANAAVVANTAIAGATATKITYDAKGLVTAGASLEASDIPSLDASKITSGTLDLARIPASAIERVVIVADAAARFALTTLTVQDGDCVYQDDTGVMYWVIDDEELDNAAGYKVYAAGTAAAVPWSGVSSKPQEVTQAAGATTSGWLTSTDWNTFNGHTTAIGRSSKTDWTSTDGDTHTVTHNWNTKDVIVVCYDDAGKQILAEVTVSLNSVVVESDTDIPTAGSPWRVIIKEVV